MSRLVQTLFPERLGSQFRRLVASSWTSNLGDGVGLAAGPLLVASRTHDPLLVALAPFLQQLPWLVFGLYAGVVADRLNRRRIIVVANLARAGVLAGLVALLTLDRVSITVVLIVVFLFGVAETFADTTSGTLLPMLVAKSDLGVANSRLLAGFTLNELAGPPLGAALFALGAVWAFAAQGLLVLAGALIVARVVLPPHGTVPAERSHLRRDIAEGVRWLWGHGPLRTLAIVIFSFNVTFGAAWSVLVLYSTVHLGMGEIGFGLLTTMSALGGLLGTWSYEWLEAHFDLGTIMRWCLSLEVFVHLGLALTRWAWVAMVIMFVFGAYAFVWWTVSQSVRQRAVPTELQGRVNSVYLVGVFGGMVIGAALGGLIARQWGITAPFWFGFGGTAAILALIWRQLPIIAHAE